MTLTSGELCSALMPMKAVSALRLEYLTLWQAAGLWALLAVPVTLLAIKSLSSLGPVRRWVALGARLMVLGLIVLILAGLRADRENELVEVIVLRDVSESARQAVDATQGQTLQSRLNQYLATAMGPGTLKEADDRLGVISFDADAYVDQMPNAAAQSLAGQAVATNRGVTGTDPAAAIQTGLASFNPDARKRLLLVWDGNLTEGDLQQAIELARNKNIPIDVMPLEWEIGDEVYIERFIAPTSRREGEPFTLEVILTNTAAMAARGTLRIEQEGRPLDLDPTQSGIQSSRPITLNPGRNKELVTVDPLPGEINVRRFRAVFEPERAALGQGADRVTRNIGDKLLQNNTAEAFTFVRGKGRVLYVDNTGDLGDGTMLSDALSREGIETQRVDIAGFPRGLVELQGYDAVILANVPRGAGGLTQPQEVALAQYVHDTGGGLLMIGGPDSFGAGGWQGSRVEAVLPVDMEVPSKRQIPKGALALVMHSTEMPQGNYWAEQCAIKAVEVLNRQDDIGVLSYDFTSGGAKWDYPLSPKGNGSRVYGAIKNMQLGDMPDFDNALQLALYGDQGSIGLIDSDARQKHVIIISDMDPSPPSPALLQAYIDNQISISTVQVAGHGQPLMAVAKDLAEKTGGTAYGPIEDNPGQLPQIFIKEATIVRRTLIKESSEGIPVGQTLDAAGSEFMTGVGEVPAVYGMVLTSRKENPLVEMPLVVGEERDPLFAYWQTGLGKAAVWTSDAQDRWAANFAGNTGYDKFFAQVVRGISRAAQSADYEQTVTVENGRGTITVEALGEESRFRSNLTIRGSVLRPGDEQGEALTLVQTKPGTYVAEFDAREAGSYVTALSALDPEGGVAALRGGTSVNGSAELLDLSSNLAAARRVAEQTGGRIIPAFSPVEGADLFARSWVDATGADRELAVSRSPLPIWDWLIPVLVAMILIDVAIRRIAWDWGATKATIAAAGERVRMVTATTREDVDTRATLGALKQTRENVAAGKLQEAVRPDPTRKFEADFNAPIGDVSELVGGASDKPIPKGPAKPVRPKGMQGDKPSEGGMSSLMEAKRRARERMREDQG